MKKLIYLIVVIVALSLIIAGCGIPVVPPVEQGDLSTLTKNGEPMEVWVDYDYCDVCPNGGHAWGTDAFATIQDGVDAVAVGGTVNVANGNYDATSSPFVRITKPLSLIGESRDGVILDGSETSTIGWAKGIHVTANNVTIENLTVQNFGAPGYWGYGVLFRDYTHDTSGEGFIYYDGCMVENVCSQNNCYPMYAFCYTNLTICNCLIQDNLSDGMFIAKGSDNAVITGNTVLNSGDHGIWVGGAGWCGPSCNNATITDNYVDGAREGGISFVASDYAIISGNTITNVAGVSPLTPPPDDGWSVGALSLKDGPSNVEAFNNIIYGNDGNWNGYSGTGHGIGIDGTPSNIYLHHNSIYGNTGYGIYNYSNVPIVATCNWWGDNSGPGEVGPGTGDKVSLNVDYTPWIGLPLSLVYIATLPQPATSVILEATVSDCTSTGISGVEVYFYLDNFEVGSAITGSNGVASFTMLYGAGVYEAYAKVNVLVSETEYLVVYDPSAGFVTGGGWIDSPAGAYVANSSLTGKATFGFVSKYKKGATVPTGNTEFQFKAGNLNFHSDSYDWLVIAGDKAMYKGTGTVNDAGDYGFMLSAIDSDPEDKFRIKIWDRSTDTVIYDNGCEGPEGTVLGGGQIIIHKGK
jgi:parallel beta-helix repeat protein